MTKSQIDSVINIAFDLADGTKIVFPVIAPFVSAIEAIVKAALNHGVVPTEISTEEQASIAAGMAAAKSSAVTYYKGTNVRTCHCGNEDCKQGDGR